MFHNLNLIGMILVSLVFLGIGCFIYKMNMDFFAAAIKYVRLSGNSQQYGLITGKIRSVAIEMERGNEDHHKREYYSINLNYEFSFEGQTYSGGNVIRTSYRSIPKVIQYCRKLYPNQIINLKVQPDEKLGADPNNLKEFKTFLEPMYYEYKPIELNSPIMILYDKTNPSDNCAKQDAKKSNIIGILFCILIASVIGAVFASLGAVIIKILPEEKFVRGMLTIYPLLLTSIIPAFFMSTTLRDTDEKLNARDKENKPVYFELIVDQNISEQHLKEQLHSQKVKYQELLSQNQ